MSKQPDAPVVGLVGLGNLGQALGLRLLDQNRDVRAVDRSSERVAVLTEAGATEATSADLSECDVIVFVVPDEVAVTSILEEEALRTLRSDQVVVVHSTIVPERARDLADIVESRGGRYVDAPVTGGAERARDGDLTVFVGADDDALAAAQSYLEAVASEQHHLGPVGAGSATKLANQLVMFASLAGIMDGIRIAAAHGVGEEALLAAIATGTADTWVGRNWGFFDRVTRDYDEAGVPPEDRPWRKDIREVLLAAGGAGTPTALAALLADTIAEPLEAHAAASLGAEAAR